MNAVKRSFPLLSRPRTTDEVLASPDDPTAPVEGYVMLRNTNQARPFRWSGTPEDPAEAGKGGHRKQQEMASSE